MSFLVRALPGRAQELLQAARAAEAEIGDLKDSPVPPVNGEEVASIYDEFLDIPAPEHFIPAIDGLKTAMDLLASGPAVTQDFPEEGAPVGHPNGNIGAVSATSDTLQSWSGDAAKTYRLNYARNFEPVTCGQFNIAYALRHAVNAEAAVWQEARDDLDKLSNAALDHMRHVSDSNQADWDAFIRVAGAVAAVGGAIPTAGASLSAWSVAGAAVSVVGSGVAVLSGGDKPDELGLANGSPQEIVDSLRTALDTLKRHIATQEQRIEDAVKQIVIGVSAEWEEGFSVPRPALADATAGTVATKGGVGHAETALDFRDEWSHTRVDVVSPNEQVFITLVGDTDLRVSFAPGYVERATRPQLEEQLARTARLVFARRTEAFYELAAGGRPPAAARSSPGQRPRGEVPGGS